MSSRPADNKFVYNLSGKKLPIIGNGTVLLMVGSYAPPHFGHIAAMAAAHKALEGIGENVMGHIYTPNSDSYVLIKIDDHYGLMDFSHRVCLLIDLLSKTTITTFVDDISGSKPPTDTISQISIDNTTSHLHIKPDQVVVVVGSDQALSLEPILKKNRAVCVIRPGFTLPLIELFRRRWFYQAVASGKCIITDRDNPFEDISSTQLRIRRSDKTLLRKVDN